MSIIGGSPSPWHSASSGCGWRNGLQHGGQLRIYWISSNGQPTRGGPLAWVLAEMLTTPYLKKCRVTKRSQLTWAWIDPLVQSKQWKWDMSFDTWNVRSLYKVHYDNSRALGRYKLDLVGLQNVRWHKESTVRAGNYTLFFYWKGNDNHHRIVSAVKWVDFINDRVSYIVLRGHWFNTIVLNTHASCEEKRDDSKDSFF